ncbi:hypothetical protein Hanom_Chr07g00605221 [Helianthus anomalus]
MDWSGGYEFAYTISGGDPRCDQESRWKGDDGGDGADAVDEVRSIRVAQVLLIINQLYIPILY